jgi:large subunit ribosomal protein L16
MLFIPQQQKQKKKNHRPRLKRRIYKNISYSSVLTGVIGLQALAFDFITPKQLATMRAVVNKVIKKCGTIRFFIYPNVGLSSKPEASRMGKGKGKIDSWAFRIQPGCLLCEINTMNILQATKALKIAQYKLPIPTKIVLNNFR